MVHVSSAGAAMSRPTPVECAEYLASLILVLGTIMHVIAVVLHCMAYIYVRFWLETSSGNAKCQWSRVSRPVYLVTLFLARFVIVSYVAAVMLVCHIFF